MPDTTVKLFRSTDSGAPTLNNTAGALIGLLDAVLVAGYGSVTLTSLVIASNVATAVVSGGHNLAGFGATLPVISIAGATPAGLNGDWRLASIPDATHFTFATNGISDQTATGTITAKRSPAGWTKPYTGTNLAAFRNDATQGTGTYFRVDDTGTYESRLVGYETMTDINTGAGAFPTESQRSGGLYLAKAWSGFTTARTWFVVANANTFYIGISINSNYPAYTLFCCGDALSRKSGDAYRGILAGLSSGSYYSGAAYPGCLNPSGSVTYMARGWSGLGSSVSCSVVLPNPSGSTTLMSGQMGVPFPNGPDNGLLMSPEVMIMEGTALRGRLAGLLYSIQTLNGLVSGSTLSEILNVPGMDGRSLVAIALYNYASPNGAGFIDLTGPWT